MNIGNEEKNERKIFERLLNLKYVQLAQLIVLAGVVALIVLNFNNIFSSLGKLLSVLRPITVGVILAYIINIPMKSIEKRYFPDNESKWVLKTRRPVALFLSILIIFSVIALILVLVMPQVSNAIKLLVDKVPSVYEDANAYITQKIQQQPFLQQKWSQISQTMEGVFQKVMGNSGNFAGGVFNVTVSAIGGILDISLGIMFAIYMLLTKEKLLIQIANVAKAYLSALRREKINRVLSVADTTFSGYITGQMVESLTVGVLFTIALIIFKFPFATMIGSITGLTTLIPILGAFLSGAVGFLMILTVDPIKALLFIVAIMILQQLDGAFIYPRIVGDSVGIPALWVLSAITIGGGLFGLPGTLIAVPVMATLYKLIKIDVNQKIKEKNTQRPNSLVALKVQKKLSTEEKVIEKIKSEQLQITNEKIEEDREKEEIKDLKKEIKNKDKFIE